MAKRYSARPSELMGLTDPVEMWMADEAILEISLRLEKGEKPRPAYKKTNDNSDLIKLINEHGGKL